MSEAEAVDKYLPNPFQVILKGLYLFTFIGNFTYSALKLVHIFSVNSHLGPLQISLGRMFIDIFKFFSIYALVLFSFACGKYIFIPIQKPSSFK